MQTFGSIQLNVDSDNVATITIDVAGKSVNTLGRALWADLDHVIAAIESSARSGVIIASAKTNSFIAGADLHELAEVSVAELREYLRRGQLILDRLASLKCPTVAAINGHALGGGLEVALACTHRVAAGSGKFIGLPETTLGLVPGWGGTQRLPRLIGLTPALELLVTGKSIGINEALADGVVDRTCPIGDLLSTAKNVLRDAPREQVMPDERDRAVFQRFLLAAQSGMTRHLPAIMRAVDVTRVGWERGIAAGMEAEIDGLVELRDGTAGRHLLRNFFLKTSAKSLAGKGLAAKARSVTQVAVIGAGTMGAGIAHAIVRGGKMTTTVIELDEAAAEAGRSRIAKLLSDDLAAGRISTAAYDSALKQLRISTSLQSAADADVVIEAIIEKIDVKHELFAKLDDIVAPTAVLASNTSSLSISEMANATRDPSRFVGLHFFNPVSRMPLVEVATHPRLDAEALQTTLEVARRTAGKTPVLVNDGPGFIVNRVLMPYLSEALRLVEEGVSIEAIDAALTDWGMPIGPLALIDTIGMDVTKLIFESLRPALGNRVFFDSAVLNDFVRGKSLGRKSGRGFYIYPSQRGEKPVSTDALSITSREMSVDDIQLRCISMMTAEAIRLFEEGVAPSLDSIDIATTLGMGFPAFRGGLGTYARELGIDALVAILQALADQVGMRFAPSATLRNAAGKHLQLDDLSPSVTRRP